MNFNKQSVIIGAVIALVILGGGSYVVWQTSRQNKTQDSGQQDSGQQETVYGGTSPEVTMDLFVKALDAGDAGLAARYFIVEADGTHDKRTVALKSLKDRGLFPIMVADIKAGIKVSSVSLSGPDDYKFDIIKDGKIGTTIDLQQDSSGIWKLETL